MRLSHILYLVLMLTALPWATHAQYSYYTAGHQAVCGALSCEEGTGSVGHNPAGTAYAPLGAGLGYYNKFGIKELSHKTALASVPIGNGAASATYSHYGFRLYNQSKAQLAYALPLGKNLAAGASISHHQLHVDDTPGSYHAMSGSLGILYRIDSHWSAGTWIENITNSQYNDIDTIISMGIQAGIRRSFPGGHHMSLDVEKNSLSDEIILRGGVLIRLNEHIAIMAGISTQPISVGAGIEIDIHGLQMQFAARRNENLGWIPSASVVWTRNNTKKSDPE